METEDKELIKKVLAAYPELMKEVYKDGASGPIQEVGGLITDILKTARLVSFPFLYGRQYFDRLNKRADEAIKEIPVENRIEPASELLIPILEQLKNHHDDSLLSRLYIELLKRSCDRERVNEAHPAFVTIIPQLSPDEAIIIYYLSAKGKNIGKYFISGKNFQKEPISNHLPLKEVSQPNKCSRGYVFSSSAINQNLFPLERLVEPNHVSIYISHLKSLNLIVKVKSPGVINIHVSEGDIETGKIHKRELARYRLSEFGELLAKACIPHDFDLTRGSSKDAASGAT